MDLRLVNHNSLQARLYNQIERDPGGNAISFYNHKGEYCKYTLEEFHDKATRYAALLADAGLSKKDVCILVLPSEEFAATLIFAVLLVGAVPLLIAPPVLQEDKAYSSLARILKRIIQKTKPRIVVCEESMLPMREELEKLRRSSKFFFGDKDFHAAPSSSISIATPGETDIAAMQLTSGTTGFPRVCVWKQKSVLAALDGMKTAMKLGVDDVCLNWTPLYHDMGLVNNFLLCLTNGIPIVMLNPKDFVRTPALWLRGLFDTGATTSWSPNFGFAITAQRVKDKEIEGIDLSHVRGLWNAAERIHFDTMQLFYERFAPYGLHFNALKTNYGCAENIGGATFSDPDGAFAVEHLDLTALQKRRIAKRVENSQNGDNVVTVVGAGRPHPHLKIKILSRAGREMPEGHIGEIALETPSRMSGYLKDARATRRAILGNLVRTGDLGYLRDDELFWVGRVRERITVRGKKLDPSDFEPVLLQVAGLRHGNFVAFGVDDSDLGTQRIVVVAEVRDTIDRTPSEVISEIRDLAITQLGIGINEVLLVQPGTLTKTSSGKRRHLFFQQLYQENKLNEFKWGG